MFPPPTTIAISTPRSRTRLTVRAIAVDAVRVDAEGLLSQQRLARELQQDTPKAGFPLP